MASPRPRRGPASCATRSATRVGSSRVVASGHPPHDARRDRHRFGGRERADRTGVGRERARRRRRSPGTWDSASCSRSEAASVDGRRNLDRAIEMCDAGLDAPVERVGHRGAGGLLTGVLVDQHVAAAATRPPPRRKPCAPTRSACATDRRTTLRRSRSGELPSCRCFAVMPRDAQALRRGIRPGTTYGYPLAPARVRRDPRLGTACSAIRDRVRKRSAPTPTHSTTSGRHPCCTSATTTSPSTPMHASWPATSRRPTGRSTTGSATSPRPAKRGTKPNCTGSVARRWRWPIRRDPRAVASMRRAVEVATAQGSESLRRRAESSLARLGAT